MAVELDAVEILKWTWGIGVPALALWIARRLIGDIAAAATSAKAALEHAARILPLEMGVAELKEGLRDHKHAYNNHLQGLPGVYASNARLDRIESETRQDVRDLHTKIEGVARDIGNRIDASNRDASERHDALVALINQNRG